MKKTEKDWSKDPVIAPLQKSEGYAALTAVVVTLSTLLLQGLAFYFIPAGKKLEVVGYVSVVLRPLLFAAWLWWAYIAHQIRCWKRYRAGEEGLETPSAE